MTQYDRGWAAGNDTPTGEEEIVLSPFAEEVLAAAYVRQFAREYHETGRDLDWEAWAVRGRINQADARHTIDGLKESGLVDVDSARVRLTLHGVLHVEAAGLAERGFLARQRAIRARLLPWMTLSSFVDDSGVRTHDFKLLAVRLGEPVGGVVANWELLRCLHSAGRAPSRCVRRPCIRP